MPVVIILLSYTDGRIFPFTRRARTGEEEKEAERMFYDCTHKTGYSSIGNEVPSNSDPPPPLRHSRFVPRPSVVNPKFRVASDP